MSNLSSLVAANDAKGFLAAVSALISSATDTPTSTAAPVPLQLLQVIDTDIFPQRRNPFHASSTTTDSNSSNKSSSSIPTTTTTTTPAPRIEMLNGLELRLRELPRSGSNSNSNNNSSSTTGIMTSLQPWWAMLTFAVRDALSQYYYEEQHDANAALAQFPQQGPEGGVGVVITNVPGAVAPGGIMSPPTSPTKGTAPAITTTTTSTTTATTPPQPPASPNSATDDELFRFLAYTRVAELLAAHSLESEAAEAAATAASTTTTTSRGAPPSRPTTKELNALRDARRLLPPLLRRSAAAAKTATTTAANTTATTTTTTTTTLPSTTALYQYAQQRLVRFTASAAEARHQWVEAAAAFLELVELANESHNGSDPAAASAGTLLRRALLNAFVASTSSASSRRLALLQTIRNGSIRGISSSSSSTNGSSSFSLEQLLGVPLLATLNKIVLGRLLSGRDTASTADTSSHNNDIETILVPAARASCPIVLEGGGTDADTCCSAPLFAACATHNLTVVASLYDNITVTQLARLLGVVSSSSSTAPTATTTPAEQAERIVAAAFRRKQVSGYIEQEVVGGGGGGGQKKTKRAKKSSGVVTNDDDDKPNDGTETGGGSGSGSGSGGRGLVVFTRPRADLLAEHDQQILAVCDAMSWAYADVAEQHPELLRLAQQQQRPPPSSPSVAG